jgi:hypothetical protein
LLGLGNHLPSIDAITGRASGTIVTKQTGRNFFYGCFLRSGFFWLQDCAILRNALQSRLVRFTYDWHVVQRNENVRNSLGLNYESPALTVELQAIKFNYE